MKATVLPINKKPSIITCIHHAYPCAIIESKELAYVYVEDFGVSQWDILTYDTTVEIDENNIKVLEKGNGKKTDTVLWRECKEKDEIIVNIDYIKLNDFARYVDVFLFGDDLQEEITRVDKTCGFRWNPYGFFIEKTMYCYDTKAYTYLKLVIDNNIMQGYASQNGEEWEYIDKIDMSEFCVGRKMHIGVHMHFGGNYYDVWKKMNFIQLLYNESNPYKGIYLDYYFFPRKNVDNSYMYFSNFLDTHYDLLYDALDCFGTIHEYLRWNIQHLYYVELCLDEFVVRNRAAYNRYHYDHYNLFYGFDDDKKVFYAMGYGENSTPIVSEIPYDVITKKSIKSEKIIRYKYNSNEVTVLKFNIKPVIDGVYEYVNDVDSSEKFSNLLTGENVVYGISILKMLASTEIGKYNIRWDKRISFCIKEHSRLMQERLEFLFENKYIEKNDFDLLNPMCVEMNHISSVILGLVLKNMMRPMNTEGIDENLLRLYDMEKQFCTKLLECLCMEIYD